MDSSIVAQCMQKYRWPMPFAVKVALEYQRFLSLRSTNPNLSPSNIVDQMWHQHILNTKNYSDYCLLRFGRLVHHDPQDANDQEARIKRLRNTLAAYRKMFGASCDNSIIWGTATRKLATKSTIQNRCKITIVKTSKSMERPHLYTYVLKKNNDIIDLQVDFIHPSTVADLKRFAFKKIGAPESDPGHMHVFKNINVKFVIGEPIGSKQTPLANEIQLEGGESYIVESPDPRQSNLGC